MKLTLLICISLLATLLHAAAMPITDLGSSPMVPKIGEINQSSHDHHASMHHGSSHDEPENYCPETENTCCLIVVLQPDSTAPFTSIFREEFYTSRPLNQPIFRPETLYRPPKFYPALVG